jgi:predicted DNA-binding protein YlxM (UPF0122 family)
MAETAEQTQGPSDSSGPKLPALRGADPKQVLQRYLSDESTKDIAASYNVTRQALGQFLLKHAEADWKDAQVARAIARKEQADDDLDAIGSKIATADKEERDRLTLSLAHARERLRSAQWDLERVCRRIYGQDAPPATAAVQINIGIRRGEPLDVVGGQTLDLPTQDK